MRLVTRFELAAKNESELHGLLRNTFNELAKSPPLTRTKEEMLLPPLKIFKEKLVQDLFVLNLETIYSFLQKSFQSERAFL